MHFLWLNPFSTSIWCSPSNLAQDLASLDDRLPTELKVFGFCLDPHFCLLVLIFVLITLSVEVFFPNSSDYLAKMR